MDFKEILGLSLGSFTVGKVFEAVITLVICVIAARIVLRIINRVIDKLHVDKTILGFLRIVIKAVVWFVVILIVAESLGISTTSLLAVFSVMGLAVSLAAEKSLSNIAGGVIIMLASSTDGHGGETLYDTFRNQSSDAALEAQFMATPPEKTLADQWQAQVLVRILLKHKVIYISEASDEMVRDFHMIPAHSIEEAMTIAEDILGYKGTVTAIPDGISVVVKQ